MLYIKASAASMAGAWFIQWLVRPVRGLYGPLLAHVYNGQTAGWIKMPLSIKVVGQCPLWPKDWMDQDAIWYGGRPQPRPHCVT